MRDVNKIMLMGRLGADPVRRTTKSGMAVVQFPVATSRRLFAGTAAAGLLGSEEADDAQTEGTAESEQSAESPKCTGDTKPSVTDWHRVIVWGRQGEACAQYLRRGAPVFVEGRMQNHKYETKSGEERWSFEVHADEVNFLPSMRARSKTLESDQILAAAAG